MYLFLNFNEIFWTINNYIFQKHNQIIFQFLCDKWSIRWSIHGLRETLLKTRVDLLESWHRPHKLWSPLNFFFNRYNSISIYGVCFMIIALYHHVKTLIGCWCKQDSNIKYLIKKQYFYRLITMTKVPAYKFILYIKK